MLDVVVAEGGRPYEFTDIQAALAEKGVKLSRARWYYMRDGDGPLVTDEKLLMALAEFFGVPGAYLTDPDQRCRIAWRPSWSFSKQCGRTK
ncbi:hypothetical protein IG195_21835 (plasmid) [Arthrobacter sp. TES]|nr:hypothetical protein IG195_21835 [Arthrobacter sp. TES]